MLLAVVAAAATATPTASPPSPPARPASVAIIWHLAPAPFADKSVRTAYAALIAADALAAPLHALRDHPAARSSLALDADALNNLVVAASGASLLESAAQGKFSPDDQRASDLLRVLAQVPVLDSHLAATPAARRYQALAAAAPLALAGQRAARFSRADYIDFAGFGAIVRLAGAGMLAPTSPLLAKPSLTTAQASAAVAQLAKLDAGTLDLLKSDVAGGQLELIADPQREPVLPLLVDAGGITGPNAVGLDAAADAAYLIGDALRAASLGALAGSGQGTPAAVGIYSPHGAYDDRAGALIEQAHAQFALFSDRVLRASPIGGSREAVSGADVAALHAYALRTSSGMVPVLFWNEDAGLALSVLSPHLPVGAMGAYVRDLARRAGSAGGSVLVLRIEADGLWNRRADRSKVVDQLAATLASGDIPATTIAAYVRANPPASSSYGFSPGSDAGALTYWMGNQNQRSMWQALADARKAAGGDAALTHEATRVPLIEAEASHWYLTPTLVAPASPVQALLAEFRSAIARIYRAAGRPVPADIAPVKLDASNPVPTPARN